MTDAPLQLQGLAYVPGRAQGELRVGPAAAKADAILLVRQDELEAITTAPAGIIVLGGAPLAHRMIRLLGIGVPTVIVDARHAPRLHPGTAVRIDGASGLISNADAPAAPSAPLHVPVAGQPVHSADGSAVRLLASVRDAEAGAAALAAGACGIGLVRSEYLQPAGGEQPDVDYYLRQFGQLCTAAAPLPVSIRLLDTSPDKRPAWLPDIPGFGAALGLQGARLFGIEPVRSVVQAQLQAITVLAAEHPLQVIIPYLTGYDELQRTAQWLREQLPPSVPLGAMAETPAAALDLHNWLQQVDFIAVGCNDLMQGLFAADRDRPELAGYLDPYAPLLYRLLQQLAEAGGDQLQRVQLCGVLPQLPGVLPVLVGLGYRAFSVDAIHIPYLARIIADLQLADTAQLAARVCAARTSRQVRSLLGLSADD